MPWADMLKEFHKRRNEDALLALPRDAETLQYLFRVHLQVAGQSFSEELKHVRLRSKGPIRRLKQDIKKAGLPKRPPREHVRDHIFKPFGRNERFEEHGLKATTLTHRAMSKHVTHR